MYEQTAEGKWEKQQAALEKTRKKMEEEEWIHNIILNLKDEQELKNWYKLTVFI
jgi:hypothetical protein